MTQERLSSTVRSVLLALAVLLGLGVSFAVALSGLATSRPASDCIAHYAARFGDPPARVVYANVQSRWNGTPLLSRQSWSCDLAFADNSGISFGLP